MTSNARVGRMLCKGLLCLVTMVWASGCSSIDAGIAPGDGPGAAGQPDTAARALSGRIEFGKGYRQDVEGIRVLHLRGSEAEMAEQHDQLLQQEMLDFQETAREHRGMEPYLGGCSNLATFGSATTDGSLWHGRNFDFSGHGLLDRFGAVFIVAPEGKIPYVTLSWVGPSPWNYRGVHTAMNAEGLTLGYMISQAAGESDR